MGDAASGMLTRPLMTISGTPPSLADIEALAARFEAACEKAVRAPAVIQGHERIQVPVAFLNARDFGAQVAHDVEAMQRVIQENNLRQAE